MRSDDVQRQKGYPVKIKKPVLIKLAGIAVLASAPFAQASAAGWDWSATPYLWMPSISTDLLNDAPPVEGGSDSDFGNIIDKIDMAFMGHLEGQGDDFGAFADVIYLSLGDQKDFQRVSTDSSLDASVFELAAVWSPGEQRNQGFEVIGGLRHIIMDVSVDFDPVNPELSNANVHLDQSYSDFMLGGRYTGSMTEKWGYILRADGSWGDTDGTMNLSAMVDYKTKSGAWLFGYRYMTAELGDDNTDLDLTLMGPVLGYAFKF
jgi:hypothetical protein